MRNWEHDEVPVVDFWFSEDKGVGLMTPIVPRQICYFGWVGIVEDQGSDSLRRGEVEFWGMFSIVG